MPRMVSPVVEVLRVWRMSTMALAVRRTAERGGRVRRTGVVRLDEETQREMARNVDRLREGARPRSVVQSNITRLLHYD